MSFESWLRQQCDEPVGAFHVRHDLQLAANWTVVFGPSGTGKSTWLRTLAGLVPQRTGLLLVHGKDLRGAPAHRRHVALVEQSPALFPHLSVERNIAFGRQGGEHRGLVQALLEDFKLMRLRGAAVQTLSGGERQRVAIARALCSQPRALLLDEVFSGMDAPLRTELVTVLQRYRERMSMPILSVTHDLAEVFATADEVLRMHGGNVTAQGAPQDILAGERADLLRQLSVRFPSPLTEADPTNVRA